MKKLFSLVMILSCAFLTWAQRDVLPTEIGEPTPVFKKEVKRPVSNRVSDGGTSEEMMTLDITLGKAGELAEKLGINAFEVESLTVRGPLNQEDLTTLFHSTLDGVLSVLNLENASLENGILPAYTFWRPELQLIEGGSKFYCIHLSKIILPEGLIEIGDAAFYYAMRLENVNLPESLRRIGDSSFYGCNELMESQLILKENICEIGNDAFYRCSLQDVFIFSDKIKDIPARTFFATGITKLIFNLGIEKIGEEAFAYNKITELQVPYTCKELGKNAFAYNMELKKIYPLEGVERIEAYALQACVKVQKMVLPATLKYVGPFSIPPKLTCLGCEALLPPVCGESEINPGWGPFGFYEDDKIPYPLYVPVGSAELYRQAWGWKQFETIIETDNVWDATASVESISEDDLKESQGQLYDLSGKKVIEPLPGRIYLRDGKKILLRK